MANEFKIKNGLVSDGNIVVTGSITATGGINISGSIASAETASFAPSYTLSSSFNSYTSSASSSVGSLSSSVATTTSGLASRIGSVETKTGSYATTGSNIFIGDQTITGSICTNGNIVTTGQIVAQTINVQQVTSSIVYSCGSNIFGTSISNTQQFTGSILATGSLTIAGPLSATTIYGSTAVCSPVGLFSGCVGIGTPTAATPLHIVTAGLPTIRLTLGSEARCHNINGVNLGRDLQVLPFRHFSVQAGNGIAEGQITLNAYEDFIVGTGASYTPRLTILSGGSAIFQGCIGICNGGAISMTIPNNNNGGHIRMACCTGANEGDMFLTGGGGTGILIAGSGKIGIGIVSPTEKLHLKDSTTGYVGLRLEGTGTYAGTDWTMYASSLNPSTADDFLGFYNNSTTDGATSEYKFRLFKSGVANFVGNVGIGTCTPSQKLHINNGGFLQTALNSSWYRNVFERNVAAWDNVVGFSPQSNPQYTYGYINITASAYTNGTSAGGVTTSRWYYSITNNSISVSVVGSDIATGSQAPGVRLIVSSGTIYVQVQSNNGVTAAYTSVFVDAMLASGYINGTYWTIA